MTAGRDAQRGRAAGSGRRALDRARSPRRCARRGARVIASVWGHTVDDFARRGASCSRPRVDDLVAVEVNVSCPNLRASLDDVRARSATRPRRVVRGRRATPGSGCPCSPSCRRTSTDLARDRAGRGRRRRDGLTLVNTVLGLARRRGDAPAGPRRRRRRAVRVPRSSRSRCARCTTSRARSRTCRSSAPAACRRASTRSRCCSPARRAVGVGTATFREPRAPLPRPRRARRLVRASRRRARARPHRRTGGAMTTADPRDHLRARARRRRSRRRARATRERLSPWFGIAKVGYELYAEAGPEAFDALHDKGFRVFADLKLHDIPTTVGAGRARARPARRRVPQLPRRRRRDDAARRRRRARARARATRATRSRSRSRSPCSRATRTSTRSTRGCDVAARRGVRRRRVRAAPTSTRARARGLRTMVPGIRLAGRRRERPGARRHAGRRDRARRRLARDRPQP